MREAPALAADIDLDLAWEFAPEDEFGFADLARDYFGANGRHRRSRRRRCSACSRRRTTSAALGKGRFKKAPDEIVQGGAARHRAQEARSRPRSTPGPRELAAGTCPAPVREQLYKILFKPDKNAPEYKAVVEAARAHAAGRRSSC